MGKEVLVTVCGVQKDGEATPEPIQIVSAGQRYEKNGKTYILYDEVVAEDSPTEIGQVVKNTICINGNQLDLVKRGATGTHLVFIEGESNQTFYNTPYGSLEVTMNTTELDIRLDEEAIHVVAHYNLELNHAEIADCMVTIHVE